MTRRLFGAFALLLALAGPVAAQQLGFGTLSALNGTVAVNPGAVPAAIITVSGTYVGTVTFQCDASGSGTFSSILATAVDTGTVASTTTTTGTFSLPNVGCVSLQAKMTAYTSGTAVITVNRGYLNAKSTFLPNVTVAQKGTGTATGPVSTVICSSTTLTGTAADTNETDIFTCTIPANTLSADNKMLRMTVYGSFGNNGDNKTLKLYWNGTNIATIGPTASTNSFREEVVVARSSATNAKVKGFHVAGTATSTGGNLAITSDWTTAMIIKVTGTNGSSVAHDVDADFGLVEALN